MLLKGKYTYKKIENVYQIIFIGQLNILILLGDSTLYTLETSYLGDFP